MGCVNATLAKRRLNPQYLKLSEEEFIKLNHLIMITNLRPICLLYTSPSPRDKRQSRMPSSA